MLDANEAREWLTRKFGIWTSGYDHLRSSWVVAGIHILGKWSFRAVVKSGDNSASELGYLPLTDIKNADIVAVEGKDNLVAVWANDLSVAVECLLDLGASAIKCYRAKLAGEVFLALEAGDVVLCVPEAGGGATMRMLVLSCSDEPDVEESGPAYAVQEGDVGLDLGLGDVEAGLRGWSEGG